MAIYYERKIIDIFASPKIYQSIVILIDIPNRIEKYFQEIFQLIKNLMQSVKQSYTCFYLIKLRFFFVLNTVRYSVLNSSKG